MLSRIRKDESGCWIWGTGKGYGKVWLGKQQQYAHRFSYEAFVGPIPEGLTIDHLCRNHACVNPEHLEPVTNRENILRGESFSAKHARKTHCKRGHPLIGDNVLHYKKGRHCRICQR